jgi:hypothetical protein
MDVISKFKEAKSYSSEAKVFLYFIGISCTVPACVLQHTLQAK